MALFALILNGSVVDLAPKIFTAAAPLVWTSDISAIAPAPQVGWSATNASGVWTFNGPAAPPAPTLAQQAATLIAGGITVTSTNTEALNGVYTIQAGLPFGQEDIATEAQFIAQFGEFTNGSTANLQWPLMSGTFVVFPTTAEFLAFAKAMGQFVAAVKLAVGQSAALPSATATIP
jgi:hypothetical protein